jgi:hypothetical protein
MTLLDFRIAEGARRLIDRTGRAITYLAAGTQTEDFIQGRVIAPAPTSHPLNAALRNYMTEEILASGGAIQTTDLRMAIDDARLRSAIGRNPDVNDRVLVDGVTYRPVPPIRGKGTANQYWILQLRRG